ncbi:hypothetical protein HPB52_008484 [Rhipicephalus sanguineus]|uniref:Uncharacterized protein n=1 Tax=Rhipicephalus sanguineus TaxID=34632 RepID=A0A9D4STP2_RHISA|nr:hypothetical protein HPB52_008484 [Rhipicephalus sanguineus]
MEDDGDADIYSGLGEYCSESTSDTTESHLASAAELDLLDSSVLPKQPSPLKSERRSQGSARSAVERDSATGTYFDFARSSFVSDDSKDTRSAVPAEFKSSDISVPPGQPNPAQKDHLTKTVARPRTPTSLEMTALSGKRSEEVRHREHLGMKRRRSPCEPSRNKRVPGNSATVDKPLRHNSPGCGSPVERRRYYSPREFGSLPAKRPPRIEMCIAGCESAILPCLDGIIEQIGVHRLHLGLGGHPKDSHRLIEDQRD